MYTKVVVVACAVSLFSGPVAAQEKEVKIMISSNPSGLDVIVKKKHGNNESSLCITPCSFNIRNGEYQVMLEDVTKDIVVKDEGMHFLFKRRVSKSIYWRMPLFFIAALGGAAMATAGAVMQWGSHEESENYTGLGLFIGGIAVVGLGSLLFIPPMYDWDVVHGKIPSTVSQGGISLYSKGNTRFSLSVNSLTVVF